MITLNNYLELKKYLTDLAESNVQIKDFVNGHFDRLKNYFAGANAQWPVLFAEWPDIQKKNNDESFTSTYSFGLFVFDVADPDQPKLQDEKLSQCFEIADDVIARIYADSKDNDFDIEIDFPAEPVTFYDNHSLFGVKVDIELIASMTNSFQTKYFYK